MLQVFSIFDSKAVSYNPPYFMSTKGQALRAFSDLVADPKSSIHAHPEDYSLYCLGEFDVLAGKLLPVSEPVYLDSALNYVKDPVRG